MEELAWSATMEVIAGPGRLAQRRAQRARERGEPIDDRDLPGRFVMRLPERDRRMLSQLTSDMLTNVRPSYIKLVVT